MDLDKVVANALMIFSYISTMRTYQKLRFSYTGCITKFFILICVFTANNVIAQTVIEKIVQEETKNSQLQTLAHELLDGIGPRLVGTPQMKKANDWAVDKYASWGISGKAGSVASRILICFLQE